MMYMNRWDHYINLLGHHHALHTTTVFHLFLDKHFKVLQRKTLGLVSIQRIYMYQKSLVYLEDDSNTQQDTSS